MRFNKISLLVLTVGLIISVNVFSNFEKAEANAGVCDTAESHGLCIGDGTKCTIQKGILTFRCQKDPNGSVIIINF